MNGEGGAEADDAGRDATTAASTSGEPTEQNGSFVPPSIRSGEHGELGPRRTMEDASSCREGVVAEGCDDPLAFYCLFDGHGGRGCADFLNERLVANITSDPSFAKDPAQAMVSAAPRTPPRELSTRFFYRQTHDPSKRFPSTLADPNHPYDDRNRETRSSARTKTSERRWARKETRRAPRRWRCA